MPTERIGSATAAAPVAGRLVGAWQVVFGRGHNNHYDYNNSHNKWRHFGPQLHVPLICGKLMWRKSRRTGRMSDISLWALAILSPILLVPFYS